jgi:hypothetical protein
MARIIIVLEVDKDPKDTDPWEVADDIIGIVQEDNRHSAYPLPIEFVSARWNG